MELVCGELAAEFEHLVVCNRGLLDDDPDKTGRVFIFGGDGRKTLALVERAAMLVTEYPEDCRQLLAATVEVRDAAGKHPQSLDGIFLLVAENAGQTLVAFAPHLDGNELEEAMRRLKRYATRLTRMDVP
jgi:hypothetical protein